MTDAFDYLLTEHYQLRTQFRSLMTEFQRLRDAERTQSAFAEHRRRLRAYRLLLANHRLAWELTFKHA